MVVGDAVADISALLAAPFAKASDTPATITIGPGGSAANAAAWLAALGVRTAFIGTVGDDLLGSVQVEDLQRRGVLPVVPIVTGQPTGVVVAIVTATGQRSMVTSRGAALGLRPQHLPRDLFRRGCHLHLSGYVLMDGQTRAAGLAALELARAAGMTISIDPSSREPLRRVGREMFRDWTRGAQVLLPNLDEGEAMTGQDEPAAMITDLLTDYQEVVLSLGEDGAMWGSGSRRHRLPAAPAPVTDTTGAGDAFAAGWLAGWLAGATAGSALESALALAALAVAHPGGRPPEGADFGSAPGGRGDPQS
ncbi:MAG: carbohydrate kinase family protein [Candidatus Dormibacteria bacterium]